MSLDTRELFGSATRSPYPRIIPSEGPGALRTGTFAAHTAVTLPLGCPVAWDKSVSKWVPYKQPSDAAEITLTNSSAAASGTFDFHVDGLVLRLDWNVTAASMQSTINAVLDSTGRDYTVACACTEANLGVAGAVMTVTFSESAGAPLMAYDGSLVLDALLFNAAHDYAVVDAGTALNHTHEIRAFIYDKNGVTLDASDDVQGLIMLRGSVHRDAVNTTAMLAILDGSPSEAELDTALQSQKVRDLGIAVTGLAGVS